MFNLLSNLCPELPYCCKFCNFELWDWMISESLLHIQVVLPKLTVLVSQGILKLLNRIFWYQLELEIAVVYYCTQGGSNEWKKG